MSRRDLFATIDGRGAAYAALTAILYGTSYVATAFALRSFSPLAAASLRGAFGLLALVAALGVPILVNAQRAHLPSGAWWRLLTLGLLGGPLFTVALNLAVAGAGATITAFVAGLYAVLTAAIGVPLLRERVTAHVTVALLLALVGTGLLAELQPASGDLPGIAAGLVGAVTFALFLVLSRRWSAAYRLRGPTVAIVLQALTAVVVGLAVIVARQPVLAHPLRLDAVVAIAWLAVGPGALAAVLVVASMRRLRASQASAFLLLNPPTAALGGLLLLGEHLEPIQLAGAALILVAIAGASLWPALTSRAAGPSGD